MQEKAKKIAQLLKVLANENRLLILCQLIEGESTVGAIAQKVPGITQSGLSQHLALLKAHGIVDFSKSGQHVTYRIADERVKSVMAVLKDAYCRHE